MGLSTTSMQGNTLYRSNAAPAELAGRFSSAPDSHSLDTPENELPAPLEQTSTIGAYESLQVWGSSLQEAGEQANIHGLSTRAVSEGKMPRQAEVFGPKQRQERQLSNLQQSLPQLREQQATHTAQVETQAVAPDPYKAEVARKTAIQLQRARSLGQGKPQHLNQGGRNQQLLSEQQPVADESYLTLATRRFNDMVKAIRIEEANAAQLYAQRQSELRRSKGNSFEGGGEKRADMMAQMNGERRSSSELRRDDMAFGEDDDHASE